MSRGTNAPAMSVALTTALALMVTGALALWTPARAAAVKTGHLELELVADGAARPGTAVTVGLRQQIAPGWHTYWRNPGDAGEATDITWTLPEGWSAGTIIWPTPGRALTGPLMNYVYSEHVMLPTRIQVPAGAQAETKATLTAHASLLVCKDVCVPEEATLSLVLPVSATATPTPSGRAEIARARRPR